MMDLISKPKEIYELLKRGATIEAQEKIMSLDILMN